MIKRFLFIILMGFFVATEPVSAQDSLSNPAVEYIDEVQPDIQSDTSLLFLSGQFSGDSIRAWRHQREFLYVNSLDSQLRAATKIAEQPPTASIPENTSMPPGGWLNHPWMGILAWSLAGLGVLWIIYRIVQTRATLQPQNKEGIQEADEPHPARPEGGWLTKIRDAEQNGAYRLAVRYHFLYLLQKLQASNQILWRPDKPNQAYLREMESGTRDAIRPLFLMYERVWYGGQIPDREAYEIIQKSFLAYDA